jgi:ABC-2 type transport system ATP-binding protein
LSGVGGNYDAVKLLSERRAYSCFTGPCWSNNRNDFILQQIWQWILEIHFVILGTLMLTLKRVAKKFYQTKSEVPVIRNLSVTLKKGEVYGFLGPNGAGKTTTVKLIGGLLFPDEGSITIAKATAGTVAAQQQIGFMPENPQFYRHLKAKEVLEFTGQLFNLDPAVIKARTTTLLQQVGLVNSAELLVKNFSKGMHQRLGFAVALMNDPALLVLDEPLDGLDPIGRLDFKRLIAQAKKDGRTVFFSTHILSDVEEICDRVGIIVGGRLISEGSPKQLIKGKASSLEEYFVALVRKNA